MSKLDALKELLAKVEAGSYQLHLINAIGWGRGNRQRAINARQAFHGSLDAAKALHEAVLPGWVWVPEIGTEGPYEGYMSPPDRCDGINVSDPDLARAWLIAILKALIAEEEATA